MNRRQDTEERVTGGFISGSPQDSGAAATGCCGEPASGPVEITVTEADLEHASGSCCGEPRTTSDGCCGT
ncbi:hypothetical protein [Sphaerimonospora thailandensis]|uniref:hypothetical protein n=1 Tax=Sphaerimonospora thailandensis TaxID=795644 RepID=UPI00194FE2F2|nr:hypothetical protein [Sphaerimonospora thailandensis]